MYERLPPIHYHCVTNVTNTTQTDDTTASTTIETPQEEIHDDPTADQHVSSSKSRDVIATHLKRVEEMFAQKLKADTSVSAVLALQERVSRLEERLTKIFQITSGTENTPNGPGVVDESGMRYTGSLQAPNPKASDGGIKVNHSIVLAAIAAAICTFVISGGVKGQRNIVTAGIAVASCAFIIAMGHMLNQYRATCERYRKCQYYVMGPWAKQTHLRWRWDQLRFETLFTAPEILLAEFRINQSKERVTASLTDDRVECISGSELSLFNTMTYDGDAEERSSDFASWLLLLGSLHSNERELKRYGCYSLPALSGNQNSQRQLVGPAVRFHELSWNSMPRESVHPSAVTSVSDIAIIARRLGMTWQVFSPEGGCIRAVGNGHGISSTVARHIGLVLQYTRIEGDATSFRKSILPTASRVSKTELYVPTREADMTGFGILPGCDSLNIPDLKVGTTAEVYATMDILDGTRKASSKLREVNRLLVGKWDAHCMYGFSDIIALAAPMIRCRNSTIVRVPTPAEYCSSLLAQRECFVVFYSRLQEYVSSGSEDMSLKQAEGILKQYEQLKSRYSEWENEAEDGIAGNGRILSFLEEVHGCWDATTVYLIRLQDIHHLQYLDLMSSHISHAVNTWGDAWQKLKQGKARDNYGLRALEAEGSHLYFDYLPFIVEDMQKKGFKGPEELVHEAWFTLMFRAFCWWRCHSLYPGEDQDYKGSTIPSRYWDCRLPVYIG